MELVFPTTWIPKGFNREKRVHESRLGVNGGLGGGLIELGGCDQTMFYGSNIVPPPLSPQDWWDPDLSAYQDTGTSTPATANNDPIGHLLSQTATGNDFVNTGGTDRPLLQTAFLNGHSMMLFDGSNDILKIAINWSGPFTVCFAVQQVTWNNFARLIDFQGNPAAQLLNSSPEVDWGNNTTVSTTALSLGTNAIALCSVNSDGSVVRFKINNSATGSTSGGTNTFPRNAFALGGRSTLSQYANTYIGRVAFYSSQLSSGDETTVSNAFGAYYGLF